MSEFQLCLPSTRTSVSPLSILIVVFNMCTFNLQCTLYEYSRQFCMCFQLYYALPFYLSAFVRKWWRAILIAIGVFLYLLYLAIFIALAAIFAPQNGKSKDRN